MNKVLTIRPATIKNSIEEFLYILDLIIVYDEDKIKQILEIYDCRLLVTFMLFVRFNKKRHRDLTFNIRPNTVFFQKHLPRF